jgi:hypothetical protein
MSYRKNDCFGGIIDMVKIIKQGTVKRNLDGTIIFSGFEFDCKDDGAINIEEIHRLMEEILEEQENEVDKHLSSF